MHRSTERERIGRFRSPSGGEPQPSQAAGGRGDQAPEQGRVRHPAVVRARIQAVLNPEAVE
jgi:hypothetical protein